MRARDLLCARGDLFFVHFERHRCGDRYRQPAASLLRSLQIARGFLDGFFPPRYAHIIPAEIRPEEEGGRSLTVATMSVVKTLMSSLTGVYKPFITALFNPRVIP
jgi:hypothetical protein